MKMSDKEETKEKKVRRDWERNHQKITKAFFDLYSKKPEWPTFEQLAKASGLSTKTVERHYEEMDFTEVKEKFRAATSSVLMVHLKKCLEGKNPKYFEMWYDFVENHDKKIAITGKDGKPFMPNKFKVTVKKKNA